MSESTRSVLARLDAPVELRFYALLDPATVPDSVGAFAARVAQLLSVCEQEAGGNISVKRFETHSESLADAAASDGLQAFNIEKGNACYLGIVVVKGQLKEALPRLSAEWEDALEFDLARAIERVITAVGPSPKAPEGSALDAAALEAVRQLMPELSTVSLEEGTQMLREQATQEMRQLATDAQARVKEAQDNLRRAQTSGTAAEQEEALKRLSEVQTEQARKLKQLIANSQAQVKALHILRTNAASIPQAPGR